MKVHRVSRRQLIVAAGLAAAASPRLIVSAANTPYVVDPAWLSAQLVANQNVAVLDASSLSDYHDVHIKGAVHCWWQDTMEWNSIVYGATLTGGGTARAQVLQDLGIDDATTVVAYDRSSDRWAARMVYFLRWTGHDAAAMLDGGLDAWKAANGAVEGGANSPAKRAAPTTSARASLLLDTQRFTSRMASGKYQVIDVRTAEEARDDANGASKLGRIPGSITFPWTDAVVDGRLKPADQLNSALAQAGVSASKPVILYARYGVETDHTWVVLKSLGFADVSIYDYGFVGWQIDPKRPIAPLPPG